MSQYRDLIARMAVDAEFAQYARAHPDTVATQYSLTPDETRQLRGLTDASSSAGPTALGARLSKSGISSGLLTGFVVAQPDSPPGDLFGGQINELPDDPKPPWAFPTHINPDLVKEVLPAFPDEDPPPPPADPDPVDPPSPAPPTDSTPPPPPAPVDPVSAPVSPTDTTSGAPAGAVTDVTDPAGGGTGEEPLQVGAPTTDTPGGDLPSAAADSGDAGGIGAQDVAIGGAVLAGGAVLGGVAGMVAGKIHGGGADDEKTIRGNGPALA